MVVSDPLVCHYCTQAGKFVPDLLDTSMPDFVAQGQQLSLCMHVYSSICGHVNCACRDITNGFQLYQSDPSGNYGGWKATAIGANSQGAQNILKQDFKDEITLEEAVKLIIKVISRSSFHTSCSAPD